MKAYFGNFLTIIALLLLSIGARASGTVTIIRQLEGTLNADVGSVTMRVDDGICHVTVTPAAGYYLAPDRIRVMKTIDSGMAQARSLVPAYSGDIMVTAVTPQAGPREPSAYTFPMPSEEYDVEVRLDFQPLSNLKYNLVVEGVQVNEANRFNILTEEVATVFFDSKNTLVLKNAQLRQGIVSTLDSLRIVLMGESSIVTAAGVPIQSDYSQAQAPLVFTTVPSSPGTLTCTITHSRCLRTTEEWRRRKKRRKNKGKALMGLPFHFISCSKSLNKSESKNSRRLISHPSQSFLIETTPGFWLFSFSIL